jgi:hypothetical protein
LVLFAGSAGAFAVAPQLEIDGQKAAGPDTISLSILGAGADYYFDASRGWHAQAMLGFAFLAPDDGDPSENPTGFGLVVGFGHEWWIGEQWSVGALGRLSYAGLNYEDAGLTEDHSLLVPGLIATLTHH